MYDLCSRETSLAAVCRMNCRGQHGDRKSVGDVIRVAWARELPGDLV